MPLILLIEDSSRVRKLMREILEAEDHAVIEAEDGLTGLQLATTEAVDCIVLDLILPAIDGLKILKILQQQGTGIPVIVVTTHVRETLRKHCLALGSAAFIDKSSIRGELLQTVKNVLGSRKKS
ncbi:MAG TPA: response regulator [Nitrospiraceae bacterium]|jgi:CheY-like chemotaxis protein|nr:response regulator [Nitrospiraceae bacterium]